MTIRLLSNKDKWNEFVDNHPQGTIYHRMEWKDIIEQEFHKRTYYLEAIENDEIKGILPLCFFNSKLFGRFLISVPYVNYGGLLVSNENAKQKLIEEAENLNNKTDSDFTELRFSFESNLKKPVKTQKVTFYLELPETSDLLFSSFKAKLRSQIKRPLKENMSVKQGRLDLLDDFYYVFVRNMRDLGTPVYRKSFFETILKKIPQNSWIINIYSDKDEIVGGAFLIGYKNRMEIPWASTIKKFNRFSPNMLLYWEVLKFATQNGFRVFDFGRCTKDSGTYRFKKQWGATEHQLYWYYILPNGNQLPEINPDNPKYQLAIKTWQKLPLFLTNFLGPYIVRNLP